MFMKFRGVWVMTMLLGLAVTLPRVASANRLQDDDDDDKDSKEVEVTVDPRERKSVFDEPTVEKASPQPDKGYDRDYDSDRSHARKRTEDLDPNRDMLFFFPTGKTLPQDELSIGFPGQGIPDIQYGLASWLQIGAGYGIIGFTPSIRLGLIRGRRVDATLVYGAFLPVATPRPFTGQYAGGSVTAGNNEFHVHLGYYWTQFFGDAFPEPPATREGGFGFTGMDLQLTEHSKILMLIATWTEFEKDDLMGEPVRIYSAAPGFRYWRGPLSVDVGLMGLFADGGGPNFDGVPPVLPMFTLRYRL